MPQLVPLSTLFCGAITIPIWNEQNVCEGLMWLYFIGY